MLTELFDKLNSGHAMALLAVAIVALVWASVAIASIVAKESRRARVALHLIALKRAMIEKGLPVEEVERVLEARASIGQDDTCEDEGSGDLGLRVEPRAASEVAVERNGEWDAGIILQSERDACYVQFYTDEQLSAGWVSKDRIRFPASLVDPEVFAVGDTPNGPKSLEVVVADAASGDWYPSILLKVGGGRYYIHYIGWNEDENEWVEDDRIRFPHRYIRRPAPGGMAEPDVQPILAEAAPIDGVLSR